MQRPRSSQPQPLHHHTSEHSNSWTITARDLHHSLGQTTHCQKPGPIFCSALSKTKNQYAYPDAPKPIHPDKEHFCSSTKPSWEQTSNEPGTSPSQSNDPNPKKLDFPCTKQPLSANKTPANKTPANKTRSIKTPASKTQAGGDGRNRTDDPLLAKQVLYQLSYIPHQPSPRPVRPDARAS